jgi:hypothetical protein
VLIDDRLPAGDDRRPLEPNWRFVGLIATVALLAFGGAHAHGFLAYLILCATVYAACRAVAELLDYGDGLREWRQ